MVKTLPPNVRGERILSSVQAHTLEPDWAIRLKKYETRDASNLFTDQPDKYSQFDEQGIPRYDAKNVRIRAKVRLPSPYEMQLNTCCHRIESTFEL